MKGRPKANYTGQRRGRLLVQGCIIPSDSVRNRWGLWRCLCDCGNIIEVLGENIKSRTKNSCGCIFKEVMKSIGPKRRRYDTLTINGQYGTFKSRCKQIDSPFLSKEEWFNIVKQPCHYCGDIDIRNGAMGSYLKENNITLSEEDRLLYNKELNGIDRLNNDIGYTLDNSVPCCGYCNRMKSNNTERVFIKKVEQIYTYTTYNNISLEQLLCN